MSDAASPEPPLILTPKAVRSHIMDALQNLLALIWYPSLNPTQRDEAIGMLKSMNYMPGPTYIKCSAFKRQNRHQIDFKISISFGEPTALS